MGFVRPPSAGQHLRELGTRPGAWMVLVRNAIPLVGIYLLGWSTALTVFSYWFDGLSAVTAIIAAMVPRALRESDGAKYAQRSMASKIAIGVFVWAFLVALLGLPYWIVLIPLAPHAKDPALWQALAHTPLLWVGFGSMVAMHYWSAFQRGYDTLPDTALKQRVRTDMYLLILRAIAMFMVASHGLAVVMVPIMALVLCYLELWPERALGMVFGDPSKLHEDRRR